MTDPTEAPSPLFTGDAFRDQRGGGRLSAVQSGPVGQPEPPVSDWDHLWHNASRVPVGIIPEPTVAALLASGALLLAAQRRRA
jgi:hypothetical protein